MQQLKINKRDQDEHLNKMRMKHNVPGVVFGPNIESVRIKMPSQELKKTVASMTGQIYKVNVDGKEALVTFSDIQVDPTTGEYLHFSLQEMPRGIKGSAEVPVDFLGTPKGAQEGGVFVVNNDRLSLSALPSKMPAKISLNVEKLSIGDSLKVSDLDPDIQSMVEASADTVIASCQPPTKPIEEPTSDISEVEAVTESTPETPAT